MTLDTEVVAAGFAPICINVPIEYQATPRPEPGHDVDCLFPITFIPGARAEMITGWHRYRIQIFPDGTCGVALDGKPIWRSSDILPLDVRYRVDLSGNSARTTMIAGPLTVWQGVKQDIDWSKVPK